MGKLPIFEVNSGKFPAFKSFRNNLLLENRAKFRQKDDSFSLRTLVERL